MTENKTIKRVLMIGEGWNEEDGHLVVRIQRI